MPYRIATKDGLRFDGNTYYHPCLEKLIGKKIHVTRSGDKRAIAIAYPGRAHLGVIGLKEMFDPTNQRHAEIHILPACR